MEMILAIMLRGTDNIASAHPYWARTNAARTAIRHIRKIALIPTIKTNYRGSGIGW